MKDTRRRAPSKVLTLAGHAEEVLRELIFSEELKPGDRIYADETAERLGMSAIPVREALRSLASRGLVEAVPQRGFRVRPADRADFLETYQLRILLDPFAAKLAVPKMGDAAIDAMERAFEAWAETIRDGDTENYDRDHRAFHFAIYNNAGSRWLLDIQEMLWENSQRYQRLSAGLRGTPEERVAEHRLIADACIAGDSTVVAKLVRTHLERTRSIVSPILSQEP